MRQRPAVSKIAGSESSMDIGSLVFLVSGKTDAH